jgi:hypothetical protein
MTPDYDKFCKLQKHAEVVALEVARWLANTGHKVNMPVNSLAPNQEERHKHYDNGDIFVTKRVEVKYWPDIDFHSVEDVPYKDVIIDEAYKVAKHHPNTLYGYVIVNKSETGGLVITTSTRKHWFEREMIDRKQEPPERKFVMIPKRFVKYVEFPANAGESNVSST